MAYRGRKGGETENEGIETWPSLEQSAGRITLLCESSHSLAPTRGAHPSATNQPMKHLDCIKWHEYRLSFSHTQAATLAQREAQAREGEKETKAPTWICWWSVWVSSLTASCGWYRNCNLLRFSCVRLRCVFAPARPPSPERQRCTCYCKYRPTSITTAFTIYLCFYPLCGMVEHFLPGGVELAAVLFQQPLLSQSNGLLGCAQDLHCPLELLSGLLGLNLCLKFKERGVFTSYNNHKGAAWNANDICFVIHITAVELRVSS